MSSPTLRSILEACDRLDCLSLFDEHEIAPEQLPGLTGDDLKEIGIEKLGHRKAILAAIAEAFARPPAEGRETGNEPVLSAPAADAPPDRPKIFLSYGRRDASELAQRLCRDLEAVGFEVWRDVERLVPGSRWQEEIEEALREAQVVVSLLSPHAVRRGSDSDPTDSVCLDELALARAGRPPTPVVPAMVAACEPPLIIYRLDYVDLLASQQSEDEYRRGFDRLVSGIREALAGKVRYRFWDDRLRPLDFSDYLARKRDGFVGREWLFDEIDLWRYQSAERALLVTGDPGAGKSSIVAQLAHTNPGGQVIAYYFCQSNERETLSPARFVQSVAAMIASRLPAYAEQFEVPAVREALDEQRCERDPGGSFLAGILQPLQKLPDPGEGVRYLLVDALDEALLHGGDTNILDVLAERIERFPSWLRLVATTRNEPSVLQRLSGLRPKRLDAADPRNLADLGAWIRRRLLEPTLAEQLVESRAIADRVVAALLEKSTGNFLYAVNALNGIERGFYSFAHLAALPPGLDGLYLDFFRRLFGREGTAEGEAAYARARPLLQVLTAAIEPLSRAELAAASGLDAEEELPRLLRRLAQLHVRRDRPNGEETIAFYHKSIADWLVSNPDGNAFAISPAKGRALLAAFCRAALDTSRAEPCWYVRRHAVTHFLEAGDWDGATAALADLEFIEARAKAQELPAMLEDYARAEGLLPEAREKHAVKEARRKAGADYGKAMVEYAATWTRIRGGSGESEPELPKPPPSVPPRTNEEIRRERERLTRAPNRAERTDAFRKFVATHLAPLSEHSARDGFVASLAHNTAPEGPVHEEGARLLSEGRQVKLVRSFHPDEVYNPMEACVAILEGHSDWVVAVSATADGRFVCSASTGFDNSVRVWDLASGECLRVLEGHPGFVNCLSVTPDGRLAVLGSNDGTLCVWDLESGKCTRAIEAHTCEVTALSITPDGRISVSGSEDETVRVWDLESGECLRVLEGHSHRVEGLALTPDGRLAVSASWDNMLRVWNLESGECLRVLEGHSRPVDALALTPDGRMAVSGSSDNMMRVWNLESGECLHVLDGHQNSVEAIALTSDGKLAVSGGSERTVMVWDLEHGNCVRIFEGHSRLLTALALTPDGRLAVSGSWDNTLRVWNLEAGENFRLLQQKTRLSGTLPRKLSTRLAISGVGDSRLQVWDVESGECVHILEGHSGAVNVVSLAPDRRLAVSGSRDNTLRVWNLESGECVRVLEGHSEKVKVIALDDNGQIAVSAGWDDDSLARSMLVESSSSWEGILDMVESTLRVWDLKLGECVHIITGYKGMVRSLSLTPDGRLAVLKSSDGTLGVWNLKSGECQRTIDVGGVGTAISLTTDGRVAVMGSSDNTIRLCDLESGQCVRILEGHTSPLRAISVSPDGRIVVSASMDDNLRVWDLGSGDCVHNVEVHAHTWREPDLSFSPDGRFLVSGSGGNTLRIWDLVSCEIVAVFFLRGLASFEVDWSRRRLVAGFADGRVEFYHIENLSLGPFITTAQRELVSEDLPVGPVTARPVCCGEVIEIPPALADRIEHWHLAGHDRGDHAYTDPALLFDCPSCGTPLRMNPFFVDVRPWSLD